MLRNTNVLLLFMSLVVFPYSASASLIHPDVSGATVNFINIVESSPTGDPLPMYGAPTVNGDQLVFPTTGNFSANSLNGGLPDETDGKLTLVIQAKPGFVLDDFRIEESGLVLLNAPFGGNAYAEVTAFAVVKIAEIGGNPVNPPSFPVFLSINPQNGQYLLSALGGSSYSQGWHGSRFVPLPADTTKVNISLNNNLFTATLGAATRSFLDKKAFEIDVNTHELEGQDIPEPMTLLLLPTCAVLMTIRRKR